MQNLHPEFMPRVATPQRTKNSITHVIADPVIVSTPWYD
jgi:hypothetical protein